MEKEHESSCPCRIGCGELNGLHHHIRQAIIGIAMEHKVIVELAALGRSAPPGSISAAADRMHAHIHRIETALQAPAHTTGGKP